MKNIIKKYRLLDKKYNINFHFSVISPLILGIFWTISTIKEFSMITLNYAIFAYFIVILRFLIRYFKVKNNQKLMYLSATLGLILIIYPLAFSMVLTILYKEKPNYVFYIVIYIYAIYAFLKVFTSIYNLKKQKNTYQKLNSYISLISSLYTLQMFEFALISQLDMKLTHLQMTSQAIILLIDVILIIKLFKIYNTKFHKQ